MSAVMKTAFAILLAAGLGVSTLATAQSTYETQTQKPSPVYSGIANALGGGSSAPAAVPEDKKAPVTNARPKTREEYRAQREARKAAEESGNDMPLPEDMFFDKSTGQWKRVVRYKSGGNYTVATTCYEITHQGGGSRVFRPVGCIMNKELKDD